MEEEKGMVNKDFELVEQNEWLKEVRKIRLKISLDKMLASGKTPPFMDIRLSKEETVKYEKEIDDLLNNPTQE